MIEIVDQILPMLKDNPEKITKSSCYWIPLQWLYVEMVKNKDLVPISELSKEEKRKLWRRIPLDKLNKHTCFKTMMCQAMYVYDKIKE